MTRVGRSWLLAFVVALAACSSPASSAPVGVSCQLPGASSTPIQLPFPSGPVTAATAEQTAVALFRACERSNTISGLTSGSVTSTGMQRGPNSGQAVWLVQVNATITEPPPGARYQAHFLIEVNQATGRPTIVGQG